MECKWIYSKAYQPWMLYLSIHDSNSLSSPYSLSFSIRYEVRFDFIVLYSLFIHTILKNWQKNLHYNWILLKLLNSWILFLLRLLLLNIFLICILLLKQNVLNVSTLPLQNSSIVVSSYKAYLQTTWSCRFFKALRFNKSNYNAFYLFLLSVTTTTIKSIYIYISQINSFKV